ncbi:BED-type domain-containing protein [Citrus sinensis]|uniref:BED-type domain-containing protein n=1 Tax=Citrus sinensis TaxID=2711 RepID=A0ACB8MLZ5_CITSI|nr:BED-type domain-containing protein [Citrus sinensis]
MSSSLPTPHLMDDEGNQTQGESAASVTHGGLRRKGRLRSIVWEHFEKKKINGIDKAVCNYCKNALVARSSDGTKHLHDHLKTCQVKKEIETTEFPPAKKAAGEKGKTAVETHFDPDVTRRKMARAIVMHEYPLSIVEHQGLRDVMSSLNQLWKPVSRNTIKKEILDMYECERAKYINVLEQTQGRIAITTDMWTAENQTKAYMAITAHFIDDAWALRSILLSFLEVPGSHTGQVLCDKLMGSLLELNIERKLSSITVDNAATNDRMIDFMLLALDKNDLILGGQKLHVRCCAHIQNLIVKDGLSVIGDLIANIRESVIFWSGSTKRKSTFDENARKLGITSGRKLVQDCPTRWNSTYLMICSALHYKNVFCRLKNIDGQYKCLPSEHDWQLASALENDLKCFYDCTTLFSGTSYPTSNLFLRHVCDIRLCLNEWVSTPRYDEFRIMAQKMIEKFDKYWHDMSGILSIACIFDPRFKIRLVEYYFSHSMPSSGSYKGSTEWILGFTSFVNVGNEEVKDELDTYLGEKLVPFNVEEEFDVLAWWKVNGGNYPILSQIARDILTIPVTTVASESAFSIGGRFVSPYRNRLHPSTLEALMCSQSWIRALCGVVASTSPAYAKILDEEPEIETDVEAIEVYEES